MERIENSVEIRTEPGRVFDVLSDPEKLPLLLPGFKRAEVVSTSPDIVGTKLRLTRQDDDTLDAEVMEHVHNEVFSFQAADGTVHRWMLGETMRGTRTTHMIMGSFPKDQYRQVYARARQKLLNLKSTLE